MREKPLVLIVDDSPANIDMLVESLSGECRIGAARSGDLALSFARRNPPDLILLDVIMPGKTGFEVCDELKRDLETKDIPVIFITALENAEEKSKGFRAGGVDYIVRPFHMDEVRARVMTHLSLRQMQIALHQRNEELETKVREQTSTLRNLLTSTIYGMARAFESRDPYTAGHQQRVATLACSIANDLGLSEKQFKTIEYAAILHDIGKIRIPVSILTRTGPLLDAEMEMIKVHPEIGYNILKDIPFPWPIAEVVRQHHEKLDGSGYPLGLKGDRILLEAKVITIADIIEAKSSYRPYRPPLGIDNALEEIEANRNRLYDSDAVDSCIRLFRKNGFVFPGG